MRVNYRDAQRILVGLKKIEEHTDTKLSADVRMRIGININRLLPGVRLYEREVGRLQTSIMNGAKVDYPKLVEAELETYTLGEKVEEYKLKKFNIADFDLKQNTKIKADSLAQIALLIRDFDDGEGDE
jgi:hypothetical protein